MKLPYETFEIDNLINKIALYYKLKILTPRVPCPFKIKIK